ncbi:uncharacterized protein [Ptychodera flava]|uniref:uncharacterized protein n=1 Tax=Ptychodera flava TaxID=63121 RepID=UPI00396A6859
MASHFQRWLSGFSTYRSYNLGVLCDDEEIKQTYIETGRRGKFPFNRSKVMFLGDARVGKTSLRRALTGERFQKNEASTEGVETRMYEAVEVDKTWRTCKDNSHTDFEFVSAWFAALISTSSNRQRGESTVGNEYCRDVMYVIRFLLQVQLLCIVPLCYIFSYGFAPFEWFVFLGMYIAGLDFVTEAYRFGSDVAVLFLIENYIRCYFTVDAVFLFFKTLASNNTVLNYFTYFMFFLSIGYVLGVLCGCGLRSGLAFGICLLHPPMWCSSQDQTFELDFTKVVSSYTGTVEIFLSYVIGLILVRSWTLLLGRLPLKPKTDLTFLTLSVLTMSAVLSITISEPNVPISLLASIVLVFGKSTGTFIGREIDAKLNMGYFTYKCTGTLIGLLMGYFMGWTFLLPSNFSPAFLVFLMSILTHPLVEMYGFWKVNSQSLPIKKIRDAFKALRGGSQNLPTRLSLWDFAGDKLYHCTHHVFLASHAIYLLVFNLEEAVHNKTRQLNRILFWLHSISSHAKDRDSVIFLVGTHRDSVGLSDQEDIDTYLRENLYDNFCRCLVVNSDTRLVFMVENSAQKDTEIPKIKKRISSKILEADYMTREFPIKYLNFYKQILSKRKESTISSYNDVGKVVSRECGIMNDDDFRELLSFFHCAGEIIYQPDDPVLEQYVVFDPQLLVDIMKVLVNIPARDKRSQDVAEYWLKLEQEGILHSSLIDHIVNHFSVPKDAIIRLLTAYDLICPIDQQPTGTTDELFSVPYLMPRYSRMIKEASGTAMEDWWISSEDEETYYFDFGYLRPDAVFTRLLARCLGDRLDDQSSTRQVFYDVGQFAFDLDIHVKLELLNHLPEQNLIKVTVQRSSDTDSKLLITRLIEHVQAIKRRDFKHLKYTFGVLCPARYHRNHRLQGKFHIVKLASQLDCRLRKTEPFNFLCEGQCHVVEVFKSSNTTTSRTHHTATKMMQLDGRVADMPPTLHRKICDKLNVQGVLGRDWRDIASEIGCSIEDVQLFSNSENPCGEVLYYWSTLYPVTIREFVEVLQRLPRADIVSLIEDHIVSS